MSRRREDCKGMRKVPPSSLKFLEWTTKLQLRVVLSVVYLSVASQNSFSRNTSALTVESQETSLRTLTRMPHLSARQVERQSTHSRRLPCQGPWPAAIPKHLPVTIVEVKATRHVEIVSQSTPTSCDSNPPRACPSHNAFFRRSTISFSHHQLSIGYSSACARQGSAPAIDACPSLRTRVSLES